MDIAGRPGIAINSIIATVIAIAIVGVGIYLTIRMISALNDVRIIKRDTKRMLKLLQEEKNKDIKDKLKK